jgi:hypothetical protein
MRLSKNGGDEPLQLNSVSRIIDRLPLSTPIVVMGKWRWYRGSNRLSSAFFSVPLVPEDKSLEAAPAHPQKVGLG